MDAATSPDTHTVTVMAGTQIVKTEFLINVCGYYIAQDPAPILFVQPTQMKAEEFSKERFAPTVKVTPVLRDLVEPPKTRDSENTITHKEFPGGVLNFVGANSPSDLSSRPVRIVLCDEIDKYPPSAGTEGDPLKLAEERASTFMAIGRAKFMRTCSPTVKGFSRIGREYAASDMRRLFVACPHCGTEQTLTWANVRWDKDEAGNHLPETASIFCAECGCGWSERERTGALDALAEKQGYGWRQTRPFVCCGIEQVPSRWDEHGRSLCSECGKRSSFAGHAGFHVSKIYSKRHRLTELVREFIDAQKDVELLRKFTNTALAELWEPRHTEVFSKDKLMARAEPYGPDDLPDEIKVVTGFCDVQQDRLEVQLIGWGSQEEAWPFKYDIINLDPAQSDAWRELDALLAETFKVRGSDRILRVAAFGVDAGDGNHWDRVLNYCKARRGRRVFACKGRAGALPIWPGRPTLTKMKDRFYFIGVDTAKDAIYSRLRIEPPEPGQRRAGFIHFPVAPNFTEEYFDQLAAERRERRLRMGQAYSVWVKIRERNEALDTFVGALAMRKALPAVIQAGLEFSVEINEGAAKEDDAVKVMPAPIYGEAETSGPGPRHDYDVDPNEIHQAFADALRPQNFTGRPRGNAWLPPRSKPWFDRS